MVRVSRMAGVVCALWIFAAMGASAQTFTTLTTFEGPNGGLPVWDLVQGVDGNFYGSAGFGGADGLGTIFRITPEGEMTTLQSLEYSHLSVQATDGNFYGTTPYLGTEKGGSVFRMTAAGELTTIYSFCSQSGCGDGESPFGGVIEGSDGNLYGTTAGGGANGYGTIYKMTLAGELTTLLSFSSFEFAGVALVEGNDGNFYGTTENGGAANAGTVFRVTPQGKLTTLHTFQGADGTAPYAALILGTDGNFYGTTYAGGGNDPATCEGIGCGTIFRMTPGGKLTTLYSFCAQSGCADGRWPSGDLVEGSDGSLYGTNQSGGHYGRNCVYGNCGTVFRLTPQGTLTTLHSFSGGDGSLPYAGLAQGTDGQFYGSTNMGADSSCGGGTGCGTVFSVSVGLGPFVKTRPTSGRVESTVTILGNNFLEATGVTFNGMNATFEVISDSEIKTMVPGGASSGVVEVTTAERALKSNVVFRVMP